MATKVKQEVATGTAQPLPNTNLPKTSEESLEDFLAGFNSIVVDSAVRAVNRGDAAYRADIAVSTDVELQLKQKANELGGKALETLARPNEAGAGIARSQTPTSTKDSASATASSMGSFRTLLSRKPKENGPAELPAALLVEQARGQAEQVLQNPTKAQKLWRDVRYGINSPVRAVLENKTKGGLQDPRSGMIIR